ncbi:MAG: virulence RhuM family protein [Candidatus Pacebacteria bacterium]|jgi:prophage maintenance system killer protein|nr:virulence RhuM family protein [Candidatus Paceibacterota bacterium]
MAKKDLEPKKGEIIIYRSKTGPRLDVHFEQETVWLNLSQIALLFDTDKSGISRHIGNIYESGELKKNSTVAKIATVQVEGKRQIKRSIEYYNLDMIISVGYRVNSVRATQFRIWATNTLRDYLVKGYAINEKRLAEAQDKFRQLQGVVAFLQQKSKTELLRGQEGEIIELLAAYAKTVEILDEYDRGTLAAPKGTKPVFVMTEEIARGLVRKIAGELKGAGKAGDFFGIERDGSFLSIIGNLYQTFGGKELYPTLEAKAAHLLYLTIKDHPFSDGNKRLGSLLFVYFLDRCGSLYRNGGEKKLNDNALAALALLVAESQPAEKDQIVALITQLIK